MAITKPDNGFQHRLVEGITLPTFNPYTMRISVILFLSVFFVQLASGQSKKEVRQNKLRSTTIVDVENGKTHPNKTSFFDRDGKITEESDYDKNGQLKNKIKYKYNSTGEVIEEDEFDATANTHEKHIIKYNALGEKTQESVYSESGKLLKIHYYTYNARGLKTQRKTTDASGKTIATRSYVYTYQK